MYLSVLGSKVQGVFLQFLLCYGKVNEVLRLVQRKGGMVNSRQLKLISSKTNQTIFASLCQRYRYKVAASVKEP